jgi:hypothetical protein
VASTEFLGEKEKCKEGGSEFKVDSAKATYACNGEKGVIHPGETLPKGATETGAWFVEGVKKSELEANEGPIALVASFPIELAAPLGEGHVHYINSAGLEVTGLTFKGGEPEGEVTAPQTACPGSVEEPTAVAGNLCIYSNSEDSGGSVTQLYATTESITPPSHSNFGTAGRTGAVVSFITTETGAPNTSGSWAVTAE